MRMITFLFAAVFSVIFSTTSSAQSLISPVLGEGNKGPTAQELPLCMDQLRKVNRGSRDLKDKKQEPKWLTNLPADSSMYTMTMYAPDDDCTTTFSTLFRSDLVEKFVGNTIDTLCAYVHSSGYNLWFFIMDANDGEILWESGIAETYEGDALLAVPCGYEIKEARNLQVGFSLDLKAGGKDQKIGIAPCYRDMNIIVSSTSKDFTRPFYDYSTYPMFAMGKSTYFGLIIYCFTSGPAGLKDNGIEISGVSHSRVLMGENADFTASFVNYGCMPIKSAIFESRLGDNVRTWEHNSPVPFLGYGNFDMNISTENAAERIPLSVSLKSINGEEPSENIEALGSVTIIDPEQSVQRNVVMEEFTGTWCGWCPRGMVAIDLLNEEYGDMFIPIAVHSGDNMEHATYAPLINQFAGSFPSSVLNRRLVADPYLGTSNTQLGIDNDLQTIFSLPTEVTVNIDKATLSEDQKTLSLTASALFSIKSKQTPYAFSYIITEDGIAGRQTNYYNVYADDYKNEPNLGHLTKEDMYWATTFNHVGRHVYEFNGVEGSISGEIVPGEAKTFTYDMEIPDNVKNINNCHVVVLLLDTESNEIVNAASIPLSQITAVSSVQTGNEVSVEVNAGCVIVSAQSSDVTVYTVDGRQVAQARVDGNRGFQLPAGNYVVRVDNGNDVTVKKVKL